MESSDQEKAGRNSFSLDEEVTDERFVLYDGDPYSRIGYLEKDTRDVSPHQGQWCPIARAYSIINSFHQFDLEPKGSRGCLGMVGRGWRWMPAVDSAHLDDELRTQGGPAHLRRQKYRFHHLLRGRVSRSVYSSRLFKRIGSGNDDSAVPNRSTRVHLSLANRILSSVSQALWLSTAIKRKTPMRMLLFLET
jgi:hypothetical protein